MPCLPVSRRLRALALAALFASLPGCGEKGATAPGPASPPPEVAIITLAPQRIAVTTELPGRIESTRVAQVRARVPGIVQKRNFREGSDVKAGDVLFRIDPAPFQAAFNSAQAAVAKAEANLVQATLKAQRYQPLTKTNAISRQEYDDAVAAQKQAAADVAAARAARETAWLNLGYATVTAPISGRIGRALVTEGALVGQGEATPLATVQQLDPIYVNLSQSTGDLMRLRQALAQGQLKRVGKDQAKVSLVFEDGRIYGPPGRLLFSDVSVDEATGSVTLRAEFPNPEHVLLPGMYARARVEQAVDEQALLVPQQAVQRGTEGAYVMVLGDDGKVASRPIKTGAARGNQWIVSDGLRSGDKVIVEGVQKVKPGAPAQAVPWQPASEAAEAGVAGGAGKDSGTKGPAAAPAAPPARAS